MSKVYNPPYRKSGGYRIDHVCLQPDKQIEMHIGTTWELAYVITGCGQRRIGNVKGTFSEGEVVLIPPGVPHEFIFNPNCVDANGCIENIAIFFDDEFLRSCMTMFGELSQSVSELLQLSGALLFTGQKRERVAAIMLQIQRVPLRERPALLLSLVAEISEFVMCENIVPDLLQNRDEERIKNVEIYTVCNLRRRITLDEVANQVGMNRSAFCTFFKRVMGKSYFEYLNEWRIETACTLLRDSTMNISEVCFESGFNSVPYFNRVFMRYKGCSPGRWKRTTAKVVEAHR